MSQDDSEFWTRARRARDKLVDQFINHPDVSLIDIGYDLDPESGAATDRIVLRVHMRRSLAREALGLPAEIDGIPVRVVVADYRLE
jgi:hypothetical protein